MCMDKDGLRHITSVVILKKLISDPNVKRKQKHQYRRLLNQMKDARNLINLIAVINVLKLIVEYQQWGQKENASVLERKQIRK